MSTTITTELKHIIEETEIMKKYDSLPQPDHWLLNIRNRDK